ncbi:MAG: hypothetical protein OXQ29_17875 [Rhodospirillaceae bacterium]|nr:hypothetical protein [Rhodospirillaceae bacterium]
MLSGVNYGLAQPVSLEGPALPNGDPLTWVASMNVAGPRTVTLKVALPESGELVELLEVVGEAAHVEKYHRGRGHWEVHVKDGDLTTLNLTLRGPADEFTNSATVEYGWYEAGAPSRRTLLNGPIERSESYPVRLAFGTGLSVRSDDAIDFTVDDDAGRLFIKNDSLLRPSGFLGELFRLKRLGDSATFDFLTSLEFTGHTNRALDGLLFGFAVSWRTLSVGAGLSFRMGQELGPGFRHRAGMLVDDLKNDKIMKKEFSHFVGLAEDDELFDGFPLSDPTAPDTPFFPTDQIIKMSMEAPR